MRPGRTRDFPGAPKHRVGAPEAKKPSEDQAVGVGETESLWRRAPKDIELMAKKKVLQVEFGPRLETHGKLGEEEPDDLDHAIQTSDRPRKSQEFCGNRGFRESLGPNPGPVGRPDGIN